MIAKFKKSKKCVAVIFFSLALAGLGVMSLTKSTAISQIEELGGEITRGFRLFESHALRFLTENSAAPWREDPELLAVGSDREISDSEILSLRLFAP